jgi:hypothetical protein
MAYGTECHSCPSDRWTFHYKPHSRMTERAHAAEKPIAAQAEVNRNYGRNIERITAVQS